MGSKVLFPHNVAISDKNGNPSPFFTRQLKILLDEKQDVANAATAAQSSADAAQATADAAIPMGALLTELLSELGGDPAVNKLMYWDDSTNTFKFLGIGSNLTISGAGNLDASGGGGGGTPWYWKPPLAAHFSTMYASLRGGSVTNAVTVSDDADAGMTFTDATSDNSYIKAFGRPIPAGNVGGSFTITVRLMSNSVNANDQFGIWARCSSAKYVFFNLFNRGGNINIQRAFNNTTWSDGVFSLFWAEQVAWLRIVISGQNTSYYVSADGKSWLQCYSTENLLSANYTDYGFCCGRFTLSKYTSTCDHLTSDEYP